MARQGAGVPWASDQQKRGLRWLSTVPVAGSRGSNVSGVTDTSGAGSSGIYLSLYTRVLVTGLIVSVFLETRSLKNPTPRLIIEVERALSELRKGLTAKLAVAGP
jgi:hypothetical protein